MKKIVLNKGAIKAIYSAVDALFDRALTRFTGKKYGDKKIWFGINPRITLSSLFESATAEEKAKADENVLESLLRIATGYMEAQRESAKANVTKAVEGWLNEAHNKGVKTDVETVLGGELADLWGKTTTAMHRIVDTESTNARNIGTLEGIVRVNAAMGVEDPVIYFAVVKDGDLCMECKRLHLMPDEITPRLWYLSEVSHSYHKKGENVPSLSGEHPHCRCSLVSIGNDYGFNENGKITYIAPGHSEMVKQRG